MTAAARILRECKVCDKMIPKRPNETWGDYNKKAGCSRRHSAQYRETKKRGTAGPLNLAAALRGWSASA